MSKIFAIIKDNLVINTIVAEEISTANALYPESTSIDVTDLEERPGIGDTYLDGVFARPVLEEVSEEI